MRALRRLLDPASRQGRVLAMFMAAAVAWSQVSVVPMAVAEYAAPEAEASAAAADDAAWTADGVFAAAPEDAADGGIEAEGELEAVAAGEAEPASADGMAAADAAEPEGAPADEPADPEPADPEGAPVDDPVSAEPAGEQAAAEPAGESEPAAEPDPQLARPAFEAWAVVGGLVVKATAAEGVLPEGTTLVAQLVERQDVLDAVAEAVEEAGRTLEGAVAVDVTLVGPDGSPIQPDGAVNVRIYNAGLGEGEEVGVYRVADDAATVEEIPAELAEADVQSFDVDHFSIYVVTDEGVPALATYYFHGADGAVIADATQIVKDGDTLCEPSLPEKAGAVFAGWYTAAEGGQAFTGFGTVSGVTAGDVHLYARFVSETHVFFMDGTGQDARVVATRSGAPGTVVETAGVSFAVGADQSIVGWYTSPDLLDSQRVTSVTLGSADVVLYPKVADGHWATFDTQGGSYQEPVFVAEGSALQQPAQPTRAGYTFGGWSAQDPATGDPLTGFAFGSELTGDVLLVAQWTPAGGTSYTVIHWQQNANDDGYSYKDIDYSSGTTGQQTAARAKSYQGFTAQTFSQQQIAGDGSTIVNIYYNRNLYTVRFYDASGSSEYTELAITARYGASIGDQWPVKDGSSTWCTTPMTGNRPGGYQYQVNIDTMPLGGDSFYGPKTGHGSETASYYVQVLPGQTPDKTVSGVGYVLDHQDTSPGTGYTVTSEDRYPITGFTINTRVSTGLGRSYDGAEFYYTRDQYTITFMSEGAQEAQVTKYYGESISGAASTSISAPDGKEDYVFAGWYSDEECTAAFEFTGKTMPAANIVVYAKWTPPTYTVTAHEDMAGLGQTVSQTVAKGGLADLSQFDELAAAATPEGWEFLGWALKASDGTLSLFNAATLIYRSYDLYPYVVNDAAHGVTYHAEDGLGGDATYSDPLRYAEGADAKVATFASTGLTAPAGKAFVGWELRGTDETQAYLPGETVTVGASDIHLYARWADVADTVSITYVANYPAGAVVAGDPAVVSHTTDTMPANSEHTVLGVEAAGFSVPVGYTFAGWADLSGDTPVVYQPGAKVRADSIGENVLTAQWEPRSDLSYTVRYVWKGADGQPVDIAQAKVVGGQTYGTTVYESPVAVEGYSAMWDYPVELKISGDAENDVITIWYLLDVELVANSASYMYFGGTWYARGYTVRVPASSAPVTDADFTEIEQPVSAYVEAIDAGTYPVTFSDGAVGTVDADGRYVVKSLVPGTLTITPRAIEVTAASATKTYDGQPLTVSAWAVTRGSFVVGWNSQSGSYDLEEGLESVTIEGSQTLVGSSEASIAGYEFNANTKAGNYVVTTVPGVLTVTDGDELDPVDPGLVIVKTHEDEAYDIGDTVEFTIEAVNIYDKPMTMTFAEQEGVRITGQSVFEDVPAGATVSTTAEAVVTEDDIHAGVLKNTATVSFTDGKSFEGSDEVPMADPAPMMAMSKRTLNRAEDGSPFKVGDVIRYEVEVRNTGNVTISHICLDDVLPGVVLEPGQEVYERELGPGQAFTVRYSYQVTEDDAAWGYVENCAVANGWTEWGPLQAEAWVQDPVEAPRPSLYVEKTASAPADGAAFRPGEVVDYDIAVVNNGNIALAQVVVKDPLTGDEWTIERLGVGESERFTAAYTVTEADSEAGVVANVATATGVPVAGDGEQVVGEGSVTVPAAPGEPEEAPALPRTGDGAASVWPTALAGALMCALGTAWLVWRRHRSC